MIEIRHLRHILALAEHKSFKRAAKSIGISQPALTISIRMAEDWFGARLFERKPRMVVPTPYGTIVIEGAKRILSKVDEVKRDVDLIHGLQKGTLRIAADPFIAEGLLGPIIGNLMRKYPKLTFDLVDSNWDDMIEMLKEGKIELMVAGYTIDPDYEPREEHVNFISISVPPPVYFVRSGHPLAKKKKVDVEDVKKFPFAASRGRATYFKWLSQALGMSAEEIQRNNIKFICQNFHITKTIVKNSDAVSAAAYETLKHDLNEGSIVELKINWLVPHQKNIGMIAYLTNRILSPSAELLIGEIKKTSGAKKYT